MAKTSYDVGIGGADNGFIVSVGCKRLVFKDGDIDEFLLDLKLFLEGGEEELHKKYFSKDVTSSPEALWPRR